ncbi:PhzF family phenazine biosynthesis protein [Aeromonas sp. BIGb0445]|jgi:PhzF family phenazine biosynthesis protein|uniref:PhzF family phenazine biosynthesis protein n=1 Tax=Aeromonas sp. BIGb0445 TaxID=2940593 RepID=UPI0021675FB6|nr:PhzF family phenazine biosynthesis protein [Aeromonas sp. BIGb0445]MCS3457907.1 PhzF family phenazine biosynthesis protein [Aeromonas sp. BIGb0445]
MIRLFHVNAFAHAPFTGNPAMVVLSQGLDEATMQRMAAEFCLSETAFLEAITGDHYRLRWFTPQLEVDLCGHGTLAAAHVIWALGLALPAQSLRFDTRSGLLTAVQAEGGIRLDFPAIAMAPLTLDAAYGQALGVNPRHCLAAGAKFVLELDSEAEVRAIKADFQALRALPGRGLIVTAPGEDPAIDFVSRYFAPWVGVEEDPVTGSNHCALAPFWGKRLGKTELRAYQASGRGGELLLRLAGDRVQMTGRALILSRGEWLLPV